jgi:hypothetical protein
VKAWSAKHNTSYGCAISKPECKAEYQKLNPKPAPKAKKAKKEDLRFSDLTFTRPYNGGRPMVLTVENQAIRNRLIRKKQYDEGWLMEAEDKY